MPNESDSLSRKWEDLYQQIGLFVVAGGQLEETVRCVLLNLLAGPHWRRNALVINRFNASQMIEGCRSLAGIVLIGSLHADVLNWLVEVERIQNYRNNVVHAEWVSKALDQDGYSVGPAALTRKKIKGSALQVVVKEYSDEEIRAFVGDCALAINSGTALIVELQEFAELERQYPAGETAPWTRD